MTIQELAAAHDLPVAVFQDLPTAWIPAINSMLRELKLAGWCGDVRYIKEKHGHLNMSMTYIVDDKHLAIIRETSERLAL